MRVDYKRICHYPGGNRGFTLIEVVLVVAIMGFLIIPAYDIYRQGWQSNLQTTRQTSEHELALEVLEELCNGFTYNEETVGGLRAAQKVTYGIPDYNSAAYKTGPFVVSYYLSGTTLYRNVRPYGGLVNIDAGDGVAVADNVQVFNIEPDSSMVSILLEIGQGEQAATKSTIRLATKILPRNLAASL
jgi:prepilin-type N-terminal cleavage/methylation domain-containing protein